MVLPRSGEAKGKLMSELQIFSSPMMIEYQNVWDQLGVGTGSCLSSAVMMNLFAVNFNQSLLNSN